MACAAADLAGEVLQAGDLALAGRQLSVSANLFELCDRSPAALRCAAWKLACAAKDNPLPSLGCIRLRPGAGRR